MLTMKNQENTEYRYNRCQNGQNTLSVFGARNKPTFH